ncbi:MAG: hypothetical protein RLZZ628_2032 [Bacteroidota bacterium]|jgi:hypothetical protein
MKMKAMLLEVPYWSILYQLSESFFKSWLSTDGVIPFFHQLIFADAQSFLTFASAVILIFTKSLKLAYAAVFWVQVIRKKIRVTLDSLKQNISNMENEKENES